ncbi:hypothetical protein niasHT_002795 [Heterodera trifolii]|uniref:Uncharacterized protein n=1 Tax=Heterodera trifolii TaxID=157864 RepID=A0ABD2M868_9BILA
MKETGGKKIWKKIGSFLADKKQKAIKEPLSSSSSTSIEIEHIGSSNRQLSCQNSSQGCSTSRDPFRYQAETSTANKSADSRRRPTNRYDSRYKENPGKILTEKHRYSSRHTVGIRENKPLVIRSDSQDTVANRQGQETRHSSRRNNVRIRENERIPSRQGSEDIVRNRSNAEQQSVQSSSRHRVANKGKEVDERRSDSRDTVTNPANERAGTKPKRRAKISKQLNEEGFESEYENRPTIRIRENERIPTRQGSESTVSKRNNERRGSRQSTRKHTVRNSVPATPSNSPDTVDNRASPSSGNRHTVGVQLNQLSGIIAGLATQSDIVADPPSSLPEVEQAPDRPENEGPYNAADFAIDVVATAGRGLFHALSFVGNTINAFITEENETHNYGTNGLLINEQLQMVYPGSIIEATDLRGRRYSVQVVDVQLHMNPPYMTVADRFRNIQTVYIERFGTDNNYITVRDNEGNLNTGRILRVLQPNQNQYLQQ